MRKIFWKISVILLINIFECWDVLAKKAFNKISIYVVNKLTST